jgi:RND family efflux transporter MFP subunit
MRRSLLPCLSVLLAAGCGEHVSARDTPPSAAAPQLAAPPASSSPQPDFPAIPALLDNPTAHSAPEWTAVLFSDLDAEVGARIAGVVLQVAVDLGDAVREGDVLLVLDDTGERARVAAATAAHDLARTEFRRAEELVQKGFLTQAQLDEATFRLRSTEAALRVAEIALEHTRVIAPFTGVITRRMAGRGRPVREGEALFRVTALQPLRASVRVPERDAYGLSPGAAAVLLAGDGSRIDARLQRISPATDPQSGTVEVLLEVRHPGPLRPGSSAIVDFRTAPPPRR